MGNRKGAFVEAREGTLFLNEIGELPLGSQAKLLRALESKTVQPLGSDAPVSVTPRVVAATHRLTDAREVSTHTVMLEGGRVVEAGPTVDLFERSSHPRIRSFLDSVR